MPSGVPPERSASFSQPSARTALSHAPAYPPTYVYTAVSPTSSTTDLPWQASYAPSTSAAHYVAPSAPHAYSAADTWLAGGTDAMPRAQLVEHLTTLAWSGVGDVLSPAR